MKIILLAIALVSFSFSSATSFAQGKDSSALKPLELSVSYDAQEKIATIHFTETRISSSICGIAIDNLALSKPKGEILHPTPIGSISFTTTYFENSVCLMAFGNNRGSIYFKLGDQLPDLVSGSYQLEIDGLSYGFLNIDSDEAKIVPSINVLR